MNNFADTFLNVFVSIVMAWVLATFIKTWFGRNSSGLLSSVTSEGKEDQQYNDRLYWTTFTIVFLLSFFVLPCYLKDIVKCFK